MNNQVTNFTNGFPNGVTLRGMPVLNTYSGNVYFVSNSGSNLGYNGTYESPFQTLAFALTQCNANKGDIIFLMPGYAEAISSAAELTISKAGVSIVGLGSGSDRPRFTFDTATTASILISADNVTIENVLGVSGINALINPFNVTGDGFYCDIEWNDSLVTVEAARAILLTGSSNSTINLNYVGFVNGDSVVNAVRLVGCSNVQLNLETYGLCSTAWVQFFTTACANITVNGQMYTQGITNLSRDVVDTVTGSTGFVQIIDSSAGVAASGGSATSWVLSSDDVSSIGVQVTAIANDIGDPSAAGTTLDSEIRTGYDSTPISANQNGSVMEMQKYLINNLVPDAQGFFATGICDPLMTPSTTVIVAPNMAGYGDGFFTNKYYMQILLDGVTPGAPPEDQVQLIVGYVSSTGTFTTSAFAQPVTAASKVGIVYESAATIGRDGASNGISTAGVVANQNGSVLERQEYTQVQVDKIDQSALAASPVAGSLSNYIAGTTTLGATLPAGKSLVDILGNPTADTLTSIAAKLGNPAAAIGTTLSTVNTNTANIAAVVVNGSGTQIATNKSLVDALGTTGSAINDSAVSIAGMIGPNNADNAFSSAAVVANADGSVMERLEDLKVNSSSATVITALGTDGTTVTDSATTVLGAIGANNANNAFDSSLVVADSNGSALERLEFIQAQAGTISTNVGTANTDTFTNICAKIGNNSSTLWAAFVAITAEINKVDAASLNAAPTAGSLAQFVASGGVGLGTPLANSRSLIDAIGSNGSTLTYGAGSSLGAIGTTFWIKETVISSNILTTPVAITSVSSLGELAVLNVILKTDGIGLATGTSLKIVTDNTKGNPSVMISPLVNLGPNSTVTLDVNNTFGGVGSQTVLEIGSTLSVESTIANCTGAGTVDVYIQFQRLSAGATIAAA